jgi:serine-type D-Ala-D-Ala carboxypeptidase (penicillin-binding protein 5/6)
MSLSTNFFKANLLRFTHLIFALLFCRSLLGKPLECAIAAQGAILINAETGSILFEKAAHWPAHPASTTTIATALYTLHLGQDLEQMVIAKKEALASITPEAKKQSNYRSPPHWLETDSSHIGIKIGEEWQIKNLISALLIASANDAANVLAQSFAPSIPQFVEGMNTYLGQIGCTHTSFNNPHGLDHPSHLTTPYDLALMAKEAMKYPLFREIVSLGNIKLPQTNLEMERFCLQTNLLLRNGRYFYPKAIGIKTGTTQAAGKNLVAAAEDEERRLIAVLMGYRTQEELYQDMIHLFETAFNEKKWRRTLLEAGPQLYTTQIKGAKGPLKTSLEEALFYDYFPSEDHKVALKVTWHPPPLPITQGAQVATLTLSDTETQNVIKSVPLLALETLFPTLHQRLLSLFLTHKKSLLLSACICTLLLFFLFKKRRPRR